MPAAARAAREAISSVRSRRSRVSRTVSTGSPVAIAVLVPESPCASSTRYVPIERETVVRESAAELVDSGPPRSEAGSRSARAAVSAAVSSLPRVWRVPDWSRQVASCTVPSSSTAVSSNSPLAGSPPVGPEVGRSPSGGTVPKPSARVTAREAARSSWESSSSYSWPRTETWAMTPTARHTTATVAASRASSRVRRVRGRRLIRRA